MLPTTIEQAGSYRDHLVAQITELRADIVLSRSREDHRGEEAFAREEATRQIARLTHTLDRLALAEEHTIHEQGGR